MVFLYVCWVGWLIIDRGVCVDLLGLWMNCVKMKMLFEGGVFLLYCVVW